MDCVYEDAAAGGNESRANDRDRKVSNSVGIHYYNIYAHADAKTRVKYHYCMVRLSTMLSEEYIIIINNNMRPCICVSRVSKTNAHTR